MKELWLQLSWPDATEAFTFITQLVDVSYEVQVCLITVAFSLEGVMYEIRFFHWKMTFRETPHTNGKIVLLASLLAV